LCKRPSVTLARRRPRSHSSSRLPRHRYERPRGRTTRRLRACAWLCSLGFGVGRCRRTLGGSQGLCLAWGPYTTAAEAIEMRAAKHVALQHLQPVDVAFGAVAPGHRHPGLDRRIVVTQSWRKTPQGRHRTGRGARQPARRSGWRVRTRSAKSRASVTASAKSACWADNCASWCSSSGRRVSGRRRTSQAAPRGVRLPYWGSATSGSGDVAGGGWRGASPCACRNRWA
jgi:hypothetical protein